MKTCPVCALVLEDSYLYCPDDGSNLSAPPGGLSEHETTSADKGPEDKAADPAADAVVLYCPMCAAEYPLTFSICPVHVVPLTRHHIPTPPSREPDLPNRQAVPQSSITRPPDAQDQHAAAIRANVLDFKRPVVGAQSQQFTPLTQESTSLRDKFADRPAEDSRVAPVETDDNVVGIHAVSEDKNFEGSASDSDYQERGSGARGIDRYEQELENLTAFAYGEHEKGAHDRRLDRPGFRVVAAVTAVALGVFGLAAIYSLVTNFARRSTPPSSNKTVSAKRDTSAPPPFIATPKEAQDYQEQTPGAPLSQEQPAEQPSKQRAEEPAKQPAEEPAKQPAEEPAKQRAEEPAKQPAEQPHEPKVEPARRERTSAPATENAVRVRPDTRPAPKAQPSAEERPSTPPSSASTQAMPPIPKGSSGGFDARLIRVRSRKTPTGVRYDLTFNMQEQAGRPALWQRVLISTRSASGASRSEAIPFSHRLGPSGALTFTISVEMTGQSEADWRGRIVCTTLGWDLKGGLVQTSFGANVTP